MASLLKDLIKERFEAAGRKQRITDEYNAEISRIDADLLDTLEAIADHVEADTPKPAKKRTKKSPPQPNHDKVAKDCADFEPAASGCLCGCGEHVADDVNFVRGHQKRLQSIARAVAAGKLPADKLSIAGGDYANAQGWWIMSEVCD